LGDLSDSTLPGVLLKVLTADATWVSDAMENPNRNNPLNLPIIGLPHLVLMKLIGSRPRDLGDLARMLAQADENTLLPTQKIMDEFFPDAAEDVEKPSYLGKLELVENLFITKDERTGRYNL
jgi:hypothetical protein